jgi:CheY-like chemotaxis protein
MDQIPEPQPQHKHLVQIRKAADFATALTTQLLAFSRRQALNPRVFTLNDTVRDLQKILQRVIGEDIRVVTDLRANLGRIKADPVQIEQVLLNLCVNARDAMQHGGRIVISTADATYALDDPDAETSMPAGEYVKLTVEDSGSGIPPDVQKHIFEPFFTTKEKGHGTGLGLATCYGIVKQSGGFISLKSVAGEGTKFSIYFPRVDESGEKAMLPELAGDLPGGHETILYVEDEITVRNVTAQILRGLGYTVLEAGDGWTAREVLKTEGERAIDMLFSDVVLPDAGGRDLSEWVRARSRMTKILFTSGYIDESILRRHGLERDTAFLQKPFSPMELARKVRETMDAPDE